MPRLDCPSVSAKSNDDFLACHCVLLRSETLGDGGAERESEREEGLKPKSLKPAEATDFPS